ncbi:MAG TPA: hypothetical protein PKD75_11515 [Tepidiformaceae bacterium]|nr:hypothetical protein [Tepidiformaceae bacterium]
MEHAGVTAAIGPLPDPAGRDARADRRHAAAECPGQGHDVRLHALVVHPEHPARPAEPGLHFAGHEQRPMAVAELPRALEIPGLRDDDAAFPLDRLDDERRRRLLLSSRSSACSSVMISIASLRFG